MTFAKPSVEKMNANERIDAIDILRGLALAGMLLVNNPGSWSNVYAPLLHAQWHGLTPTDLVFPFFLFVVGAAMAYSFKAQISTQKFNWLNIYRRTFLLIGIGILLSAFPYTKSLENWRLPGVLQRIGLCYFIVACLLRYYRPKQLFAISVATLVAYWLVLQSYGLAPYAAQTNIAGHIDMLIIGESHLYRGLGFVFDPEGLLSTLPAAITCLSGYLVTLQLQQCESPKDKIKRLALIGITGVILGLAWHWLHPINKSLWTGSYVLVTSGIACLVLTLIIICWDQWNIRLGLQALKVYGSNPILLFVLAGIVARILILTKVEYEGLTMTSKAALFNLLTQFMPAKQASLVFAVLFMVSFYALALLLYRKRIFVKI